MTKRIRLQELIFSLRAELQGIIDRQSDSDVIFCPSMIEIEAQVFAEESLNTKGKMDVWVLSIGGAGTAKESATQRVKITMSVKRREEGGRLGDLVFGEPEAR